MNPLRPFADWFTRHKYRIGIIAVSHTAKQIEEYLFDWLVYGAVVLVCTSAYGPAKGAVVAFLIMTPVSALFCWLYIRIYDWTKRDWFGLEALKELRETESGGWLGKLIGKASHWGSLPVFLLLTIHSDPFMVTVYFRKREHVHAGLTRRDWIIFWASVFFANLYWTFGLAVIIDTARFVLTNLHTL